jgi:superfamily II DNA/RNA helicase
MFAAFYRVFLVSDAWHDRMMPPVLAAWNGSTQFCGPGVLRPPVLGTSIREAFGYTDMNPIQALTIPSIAAGKHVRGEAHTGQGKTLVSR